MEANRTTSVFSECHSADEPTALLQVPQFTFCQQQRSLSVDNSSTDTNVASFLEVPKRFQRRRSSNTKTAPACVHCQCVEEYERWLESSGSTEYDKSEIVSSDSMSDDDDDNDESESSNTDKHLLTIPLLTSHCNINISLSPTTTDLPTFPLSAHDATSNSPPPLADTECDTSTIDIELPPQPRARRRSISRQEAIFIEPTGNSLENVADASLQSATKTETDQKTKTNNEQKFKKHEATEHVKDFYLAVPETDLRRDRAASVDSSFSKLSSNGKQEELTPKIDGFLAVPTNAVRSRSVDIVLPTNEQERYKALALAGPSMSKRYVIFNTQQIQIQLSIDFSFENIFFNLFSFVFKMKIKLTIICT